MRKGRLEAFSDGVIAILITIMVLELKQPEGTDWAALHKLLPVLASYVLSFVYIGIYWNNHHHLLQATTRVNAAILWANLHLLFWLSVVPFVTAWMGEHPRAVVPTATYAIVLTAAGLAYYILAQCIIANEGRDSAVAIAVGRDVKGLASLAIYLMALGAAFVATWAADVLFVAVAVMWFIPDRRIASKLADGAVAE